MRRRLGARPWAAGWLAVVGVLAAACRRPAPPAPPEVRVACAADAVAVVEALAKTPTDGAAHVTVVAGASGVLARQLAEGAPFHVFASASAKFVDDAVRAGACDGATRRPYAFGALAVVRRRTGRAFAIDDLADPALVRVALADPEHAPYGKAAAEALAARGLDVPLARKLVRAGDVRRALELVLAGGADAALVARSLAREHAAELDVGEVPGALHAPLRQEIVVCARAGSVERGAAERFADRVTGPEGRAAFLAAGFELPVPPDVAPARSDRAP